jgi:hypothetical protein
MEMEQGKGGKRARGQGFKSTQKQSDEARKCITCDKFCFFIIGSESRVSDIIATTIPSPTTLLDTTPTPQLLSTTGLYHPAGSTTTGVALAPRRGRFIFQSIHLFKLPGFMGR